MNKISLLAILFVMIVNGCGKPVTKPSTPIDNDRDGLSFLRDGAEIIDTQSFDNPGCTNQFMSKDSAKNIASAEHKLDIRRMLIEKEERVDTTTSTEGHLEITGNKGGKDTTINDNSSKTSPFLKHHPTTTFKTIEALKEAEEALKEKVAEIEAEPIILSARI
uniref:Uncharacterized protein n=1 Tax=Glossina brevipalpis TaxID=37001 RepID=A0A1A9WFK0_9MUSC